MVITASAVSLGDTADDNLVTVDLETCGYEAAGSRKPSKEYRYHADILRLRPDVQAVLHVHPPYATTFAVQKRDIPMVTDAGFKQNAMPRVGFAPSGSDALRELVVRAVREHADCAVLLLEQHGITTLGTSVVQAFDLADLAEELARIAYLVERNRFQTAKGVIAEVISP
jgi:ribulose-5-phosphate 4-epimerase/fuculose-1-phosphate aldolase